MENLIFVLHGFILKDFSNQITKLKLIIPIVCLKKP